MAEDRSAAVRGTAALAWGAQSFALGIFVAAFLRVTRSPVVPFLTPFLGEGSPTTSRIDYRKKGVPAF